MLLWLMIWDLPFLNHSFGEICELGQRGRRKQRTAGRRALERYFGGKKSRSRIDAARAKYSIPFVDFWGVLEQESKWSDGFGNKIRMIPDAQAGWLSNIFFTL